MIEVHRYGDPMESNNPLIPQAYDVVWSVVAVAMLVLFVVALVSLVRSARALGAGPTALWAVLLVLVPLIGPVVWLTAGRTSVRTRGGGHEAR
jgi:NADH:ubiquinone oxidoreductase subunit 6 (subunit J)